MTRDYGQVTCETGAREQVVSLHVCAQTVVIAVQDGYHTASVRLDMPTAGRLLTKLVDALVDLDNLGGEQVDPWQV